MQPEFIITEAPAGMPPPTGSIGDTLAWPGREGYAHVRARMRDEGDLPAPEMAMTEEERRRTIETWLRGGPRSDGPGTLPGVPSDAGRFGPASFTRGTRLERVAVTPPGAPSDEPPSWAGRRPAQGFQPGLRTPFDAETPDDDDIDSEAEFTAATGFDRSWGDPPLLQGLRFDAARALYTPDLAGSMQALGGPNVGLRLEALDRQKRAEYLQPIRSAGGATSAWEFRWVKVASAWPSLSAPYRFVGMATVPGSSGPPPYLADRRGGGGGILGQPALFAPPPGRGAAAEVAETYAPSAATYEAPSDATLEDWRRGVGQGGKNWQDRGKTSFQIQQERRQWIEAMRARQQPGLGG